MSSHKKYKISIQSTRRKLTVGLFAVAIFITLPVVLSGLGILNNRVWADTITDINSKNSEFLRNNVTAEWIDVHTIKVVVNRVEGVEPMYYGFNLKKLSAKYEAVNMCVDGSVWGMSVKGGCMNDKNDGWTYAYTPPNACENSNSVNSKGEVSIETNRVSVPQPNSSTITLHFAVPGNDGNCWVLPVVTIDAKQNKNITQEDIEGIGGISDGKAFEDAKGGLDTYADPCADPATRTDSSNGNCFDCTDPGNKDAKECSFTRSITVPIINILSAIVGVVIVLSIVVAGIQYITAGGNSAQVAQAKTRIGNAILALVLYIFGFALLQWLIPGGIFH